MVNPQGNMSTDPSDAPTEGRMSAVFSTLREALRPGDARHQPSTNLSETTSSSSSLPHTAASSTNEDTFSSGLLAENKQHGPNGSSVSSNEGDQAHKGAFLDSHRDATGHASVMDSIMPGNQGLPVEEPSNARSESTPKTRETENQGSGSILGALKGWTKGQSSTAPAGDDEKARAEPSLGDLDTQNEENYTLGKHAGESTEVARDRESAQPRTVKMDNNIVILSSQQGETTRQKMDELPGSVARESQVSR